MCESGVIIYVKAAGSYNEFFLQRHSNKTDILSGPDPVPVMTVNLMIRLWYMRERKFDNKNNDLKVKATTYFMSDV
jgi:hypothetical protein